MTLSRCKVKRRPHPVWALNAAIAAGAAALYLGPVAHLAPLARPHLSWWVIAPLFAAAEMCVVHLHFRRGAHTFSLGEIPLVLGLVFSSGRSVVFACVLGSALVLLVGRRQPPVKLVFNLAQFTVATSIATLSVHALARVGASLAPTTWLAVLLAVLASGVATVLMIASAMYLAEREMHVKTIGRMLATDGAVALNNACLALCAAVVLSVDASALPLLIVPLGTLFVAYRAYLSELERQKQLDFMLEANRTLTGTGEMASALELLLDRSLQVFRAQAAEIVLFGVDGAPPERMVLAAHGHRQPLAPVDAELADHLRRCVEGNAGTCLLGAGLGAPAIAARLGHGAIRQAMVAPLRNEDHLVGVILLVNRLSTGAGFDRDDLRLLETLAANTSVALQNDRLEQAVHQLSRAHDDLHRAANYDALTAVLNRRAFTDQARAALAQDPLSVALLFVDLDNFKSVNDTLGHARGDELLLTIASRLRACVRGDDVVARLGGDEFAVMVRAPGIIETAAVSVAERIVRSCRIDVSRDDVTIPVSASVGIAVCRSRETTAPELIHAADMAMYEAKTSGKGAFAHAPEPTSRTAVTVGTAVHTSPPQGGVHSGI